MIGNVVFDGKYGEIQIDYRKIIPEPHSSVKVQSVCE